MGRFAEGVAAIGAAVVVAVAGADELPAVPGGEWREWRSGSFVAVSDAPEEMVRRVLLDLEEMRAVLEQTATLQAEAPVPTVLYLFHDRRSFEPYALDGHGGADRIAGFFARREDLGFMAIDGDRRRSASETVFHEYVHHLLSHAAPGLPLWLEEGLAELYQTFEVAAGTARVGLPIEAHLLALRLEGLLPLELVRSVHRDHPVYRGGDHRGRFYAQAWAMAHYLLLGAEDRRGQVARFVDLLARGTAEDDAFDDAFGDPDTLREELARYLERRILPSLQVPVTVTLQDDVRGRALSAAETWTRLGELLAVQLPPRPEADDHFRAALAHDPAHGPALSGLAGLAEGRADWSAATELHRRAAASAPSDAHVRFRSGAYLLERGDAAVDAIDHLRAAVEIEPGLGPAWTHLAAALELVGGDPAQALRVARAAAERMPSDRDSLARLVRLEVRAGPAGRAEAAVREAALRDPADRRRLASTLVATLANEAAEALVDDRIEVAERLLDRAEAWVAAVHDPRLARRLEELRATIRSARLVDRYLEAVRLAVAGQRADAVRILDEVLASKPDEKLHSVAAALRDRMLAPRPTPTPHPAGAITLVSPGEVQAVNERIAAGDLDGAIELLEELDRRVDRGARSWIDVKLEELRRARDHNRFAERYNRAVELLNGGRPGAAVVVLDELLATLGPGADADTAKRLRDRAADAAARP